MKKLSLMIIMSAAVPAIVVTISVTGCGDDKSSSAASSSSEGLTAEMLL